MSNRDAIIDVLNAHDNSNDRLVKQYLCSAVRRMVSLELGAVKVRSCHDDYVGHDGLTDEEREFTREGKKLNAVKLYKTRTGKTLIDSKHEVEAAMRLNGIY